MLRGVLALTACLVLTRCLLPGDDPSKCVYIADWDANAMGLVNDPLVGAHQGTLTWIETAKTTPLTVSFAVTDPVTHYEPQMGSDPCDNGYSVVLQASAQTGDGLIQQSWQAEGSAAQVDSSGHIVGDSIDVALNATPILDGGAAPEEPNLAAQRPLTADLIVTRADGGAPASATLTVTSAQTKVTLATAVF